MITFKLEPNNILLNKNFEYLSTKFNNDIKEYLTTEYINPEALAALMDVSTDLFENISNFNILLELELLNFNTLQDSYIHNTEEMKKLNKQVIVSVVPKENNGNELSDAEKAMKLLIGN